MNFHLSLGSHRFDSLKFSEESWFSVVCCHHLASLFSVYTKMCINSLTSEWQCKTVNCVDIEKILFFDQTGRRVPQCFAQSTYIVEAKTAASVKWVPYSVRVCGIPQQIHFTSQWAEEIHRSQVRGRDTSGGLFQMDTNVFQWNIFHCSSKLIEFKAVL